ncbi:MAG TPA: phosphatase PAP2 family protein [Patescibacteria group bacterium]|nr:phosphatase PAP2 family protein [Patescibacteria group bacterium]
MSGRIVHADQWIASKLNALAVRSPAWRYASVFAGHHLFFFVVVFAFGAAWTLGAREAVGERMGLLALCSGGAWIVRTLVSMSMRRQRPYQTLPITRILQPTFETRSFPSGHAAASFGIAGFFLWFGFGWVGWIAVIAAGLISTGRVCTGVHYPSDVFVGAAIGLLVSWAVRVVM